MKCAADFRREARDALRGKWTTAVLIGLAAVLLGATGDGVGLNFKKEAGYGNINLTFAGNSVYTLGRISPDSDMIDKFFSGLLIYVLMIGIIVAVVQFILGCITAVGYAKFNLDLVDGEEERNVWTLFHYLPQWKTMLAAGFLQAVYTFLWTLLFIIPGIVAGYRYAMTSFILAENPELRASEAIARSKEMMDGQKWRMFCLDLSFIGWIILSSFTLGIGQFWLTPYQRAAQAAFYRDVSRPVAGDEMAKLVQETALGE